MPLDLPFHRSWFEQEEIDEVVDTLNSGWLTTGPKTQRFEKAFQEYIGCKHAVALNSCTAGLHLSIALQNFDPGSEIITTPMTFPATANTIVHENLKPVFADIEPETLNIDPDRIEEKITSKTRAIIPVHFAGHPCNMDSIEAIAKKHQLVIIEDGAHALESKYKGKKIGSFGHLTAFSFYANKNITTGEGGMLVTNDEGVADQLRIRRLHGLSRDAWKRFGKDGYSQWKLECPGFKYNMPDIMAALGIHQLRKVERFYQVRKTYYDMYHQAFKKCQEIELLQIKDYAHSALHLFILALKLEKLTINRSEFLELMQKSGIGVAVHYIALHIQPFYVQTFGYRPEQYPIATEYSDRILSLPLYPKMTPDEVQRVIQAVTQIIAAHRK